MELKREESMKKHLSGAAFLSDKAVLIYLALSKLVIHLVFNGRYGYFRDEIYNIVCGDRLSIINLSGYSG